MRFRVLFVCTGNLCRSPMAEGILKHRLAELGETCLHVSSAGTMALPGRSAEPWAVTVCAANGIDLTGHRAAPVTADLIDQADLVLAMGKCHVSALRTMNPEARGRIRLFKSFGRDGVEADVEDPMGFGEDAYLAAFEDIEREIERMLPLLIDLAMRPVPKGNPE
jgi:protein-tyrosine phosphatase